MYTSDLYYKDQEKVNCIKTRKIRFSFQHLDA